MNYIFNNAEDIAYTLSEEFTAIPDNPGLKEEYQQGLREFGLNGMLVGDSPLRIIGAWNTTSALLRQARQEGLLTDQIENGLVLYAQQSASITDEQRAKDVTTDELIDDKIFRFADHPVETESDYTEDSDQDVMITKYSQSRRPYSRTKITETALRLAVAAQANHKDIADQLRTSLDYMMTVNSQADPDKFHLELLEGVKYPVHYSRGPNIDKLSMPGNTNITEKSLRQNFIEIREHFSEYLNGQWVADAVSKQVPFLYASVISQEELDIILSLKTEPGCEPSLSEMLEQFGEDICSTETYQLVKQHYEQHKGTAKARYTSHISGVFKPDDKGDIDLTSTGKEIFYLLDLDYLPCVVEGRLFFSLNGDESLVKDSISKMCADPQWSSVPHIIDLLPRLVDDIINVVTEQPKKLRV